MDYQLGAYATPAIDLTYILLNFISDSNRFSRYDEVLAVYHEQFSEALKKFGYLKQPPALLDVQIEMMRNGHLFAILLMFMFPYLIIDYDTLTEEDFGLGPNHLFAKCFVNERYRNVLKEGLNIFLAKGYFTV